MKELLGFAVLHPDDAFLHVSDSSVPGDEILGVREAKELLVDSPAPNPLDTLYRGSLPVQPFGFQIPGIVAGSACGLHVYYVVYKFNKIIYFVATVGFGHPPLAAVEVLQNFRNHFLAVHYFPSLNSLLRRSLHASNSLFPPENASLNPTNSGSSSPSSSAWNLASPPNRLTLMLCPLGVGRKPMAGCCASILRSCSPPGRP